MHNTASAKSSISQGRNTRNICSKNAMAMMDKAMIVESLMNLKMTMK